MNSLETQRYFIGSGLYSVSLAPESGLNDLVFWHRLSWETYGFTQQISHHLSSKNYTRASLPEGTQPRLLLKLGLTAVH